MCRIGKKNYCWVVALPKSHNLITPSAVSSKFSILRSRWIMGWSRLWRAWTALQVCQNTELTSSGVSGEFWTLNVSNNAPPNQRRNNILSLRIIFNECQYDIPEHSSVTTKYSFEPPPLSLQQAEIKLITWGWPASFFWKNDVKLRTWYACYLKQSNIKLPKMLLPV